MRCFCESRNPTRCVIPTVAGMTIACAVHWYESLLFLAPVAITMGVLWVMSRVERRREEREERGATAEPSPIYH